MKQHCNVQKNSTIQHDKVQNNAVTYKQYFNSTK